MPFSAAWNRLFSHIVVCIALTCSALNFQRQYLKAYDFMGTYTYIYAHVPLIKGWLKDSLCQFASWTSIETKFLFDRPSHLPNWIIITAELVKLLIHMSYYQLPIWDFSWRMVTFEARTAQAWGPKGQSWVGSDDRVTSLHFTSHLRSERVSVGSPIWVQGGAPAAQSFSSIYSFLDGFSCYNLVILWKSK